MRELILILRGRHRDAHHELGALPRLAVDLDGAAVRLYDIFDQAQAQTGSMDLIEHGALAAEERIEDVRLLLERNPGAMVGYANLDHRLLASHRPHRGDADPVAGFGAILGGVADQVLQ